MAPDGTCSYAIWLNRTKKKTIPSRINTVHSRMTRAECLLKAPSASSCSFRPRRQRGTRLTPGHDQKPRAGGATDCSAAKPTKQAVPCRPIPQAPRETARQAVRRASIHQPDEKKTHAFYDGLTLSRGSVRARYTQKYISCTQGIQDLDDRRLTA